MTGQAIQAVSDEILPVLRVSRDGGDYAVKCPHCGAIVGLDADDLSELHGEQFQHRKREWSDYRGQPRSLGCDGWFEISQDARFAKKL